MEKIVVTTDFSANSNAAIVYAANLAKIRNEELVILHIYTVFRASFWSDDEYHYYVQRYKDTLVNELAIFVQPLLQISNLPIESVKFEVYHNFDIVDGILEYVEDHPCAYICISTRGAGVLAKVFGTHTSRLIIRSKVPVLCIPSKCTYKEIGCILYLTDMTSYKNELPKVVAFASPLNAEVKMLHFYENYNSVPNKEFMQESLQEKYNYSIRIKFRARNDEVSLLEQINKVSEKLKPSVIVMFTDQNRSFFERVFALSNAKVYSFYGNIPLLVFNKI